MCRDVGTLPVAMHVSIGMSSAAFMAYLSIDVCVCMNVFGRACEQHLEKCSGDKAIFCSW